MCAVRKTHWTLAFLVFFFFVSALSLHAQVAPAATKSGLSLSAGAEGSVFQPDYAGNSNPNELTSPERLYGVGAYVDARFTRWVQIEAEGRWLQFNEYQGIGENTYMIGPRVPICEFHRWSPYGKFLVGWGSGAGGWLTGRAGTYAFGGGVEYRLSHRITIRPFDFEYQRWQVNPTLWPYGGSAGLSYRIF
jgi:Outer membrane protein beta-barrel domain